MIILIQRAYTTNDGFELETNCEEVINSQRDYPIKIG